MRDTAEACAPSLGSRPEALSPLPDRLLSPTVPPRQGSDLGAVPVMSGRKD